MGLGANSNSRPLEAILWQLIINKISKGHEFERDWKGVYGRAWRKETEERNTIINSYFQK